MQTIHAEIVKPVFKQLKDPNLDGANNEPSTTSIQITPDGKKMFLMDHLETGATDALNTGGTINQYADFNIATASFDIRFLFMI